MCGVWKQACIEWVAAMPLKFPQRQTPNSLIYRDGCLPRLLRQAMSPPLCSEMLQSPPAVANCPTLQALSSALQTMPAACIVRSLQKRAQEEKESIRRCKLRAPISIFSLLFGKEAKRSVPREEIVSPLYQSPGERRWKLAWGKKQHHQAALEFRAAIRRGPPFLALRTRKKGKHWNVRCVSFYFRNQNLTAEQGCSFLNMALTAGRGEAEREGRGKKRMAWKLPHSITS